MSVLHVTKNGRTASFRLNDNKSDLLDRHVNLDTGRIYYTMGKQIGGKPINPNGKLGRELRYLSEQLMARRKSRRPPDTKSDWRATMAFAIIFFVLWLILH